MVSQLAEHQAQTQPGLRDFIRRNLFRVRQFYEIYRGDEKSAGTADTITLDSQLAHSDSV